MSDIKSYIIEVNNRIDEYCKFGTKELENKLADDHRNILTNFYIYGSPSEMFNCIKRLCTTLTKRQSSATDSLTNINSNKAQADDKCESKTSGQTQRGIEIQEELAFLRDETKRKDLNPIEKENLTDALIKLQNEITSNMDKFSKFDSIPVRLNQIENYLEKLKNREEIKTKTTETIQKTDVEEKKDDGSKKNKMQLIWKFSL